jgi:hypothetical protein
MRPFLSFLTGVASNWEGILIRLLGVFERWRNRPLAWKAYRWFAAGAVFATCYVAWSTEHEARVIAEPNLKAGEAKLADRQLSKERLAPLQRFYQEADTIIEAYLPKDIFPEDFDKGLNESNAGRHHRELDQRKTLALQNQPQT